MKTILCCLLLCAAIQSGEARQIEDWPYERLFAEADLVVIAAAEATEESEDNLEVDGWAASDFVGQNTMFEIQSTLKGAIDKKTIQILHFRAAEGRLLENGPLFVAFRHGALKAKWKDGNIVTPVEYLLFLRKLDDGRFELVSGQIDPELAVREMHPTLP